MNRPPRRRAGPRIGRGAELTAGLMAAVFACALAARASDATAPPHTPGAAGAGPTLAIRTAPAPSAVAADEPGQRAAGALDESFDRDEAMAQHAPTVHQTRLTARLDTSAHTVHGEGEIRWKNTSVAPVSDVYFHLYLNAFKNNRTVFLRSHLGEGRGEKLPTDWGFSDLKRLTVRPAGAPAEEAVDLLAKLEAHSPGDPDDQTDLRAPLPSACPPGGELLFELTFDAKLPTITERTGYHNDFHMVAQWFPKLARLRGDGSWSHFAFHRLSEFDADFGGYDVTLDVPEGTVVGATGRRVEEQTAGGRRTLRYEQQDVHDFAWTAWSGFRERSVEVDGVQVRALFPEGHEPAAARQLEAAAVGLRCMGRLLGRYPYPTLTLVQPPSGAGEAGGMEYPTLITTGGPWSGPPLARFSEAVTVHELGHQYFYGLLASDEHRYPFLDEGVNTFVENLCLREGYGAGSFLSMPGLEVEFGALNRIGALSVGHDDIVARGSPDFPSARHYGRLVYSRTATLLATLRGAFGASAFDRALGRYARAYRFQHPSPRHLIAAFSGVDEAMGKALSAGLFERAWVDYAISEIWSDKLSTPGGIFDPKRTADASTPREDRHVGWALVVRRGPLELPVSVRLRFADGTERTERWDGRASWARFEVEGPSELIAAEVDPEHAIALDEDFSNNARARTPARLSGATLDRWSYLGGLLGHLLAP